MDLKISPKENSHRYIKISITNNDNNMEIAIHDNGNGIPDTIINKIFEPYFTTKEHNGTGIGLYISKEIIHKHMKGTLKAKNIKNGTNFITIQIY